MQHPAIVQSPRSVPLIPMRGHPGTRRSSLSVRGGDSMRLVAAMAGPALRAAGQFRFNGARSSGRLTPYSADAAESDVRYYSRRSTEEGRAAVQAASPKARELHRELAARYARLSRDAARSRALAPPHGPAAFRARLTDLLRQRFGLGASQDLPDRASIFRSGYPAITDGYRTQ